MRAIFMVVPLAALLAGVTSGGALRQEAGGDPWRLVHPEAKWILGVDWARARNSLGAQILKRQFADMQGKVQSSGLGLGAVVTLDRIIASGVSMEAGGAGAPKGMVVAIEGKLDRARLKKEVPPGTAVEKFKGADLYVPPKADPREPLLAVVSDGLMLMGDRESLGLVLSGQGGARDSDLHGSAARLAGSAEIWLVAAAPQMDQATAGQQPDPYRDLKRVELSIHLQQGLRVTALMAAASKQSAENLAGMMQLAGAMGGGGAAGAWLRRLRVEQRGEELAMTLDVPAKELEQGIVEGKRMAQQAGKQALDTWLGAAPGTMPPGVRPAVKGAAAAGAARGAVALPAAPPEPKVRTIRIVGVDRAGEVVLQDGEIRRHVLRELEGEDLLQPADDLRVA